MESLAFRHVNVADARGLRENWLVLVRDGRVAHEMYDDGRAVNAREIDGRGLILSPGFIDLHTHGAMGFRTDASASELSRLCKALPQFGVTGFLPAVTPCGDDAALLAELASAQYGGAAVLGFFLEGHFLALGGAIRNLPKLNGAASVRAFVEAALPYRLAFGVSPELREAEELIPAMLEGGITPFVTHTAATVEQTECAIALGARHATHFYDVFPYPGEIEPGVRGCGAVEVFLANPDATVDFILDGAHVQPIAAKLALRCKGPSGVCLVTDSNTAAGFAPGVYKGLAGMEIVVEYSGAPAREVRPDGTGGDLVGSGLTMIKAVGNAVRMLGAGLSDAICMATHSPAKVLGLDSRKGLVREGYDADLVLISPDFEVRQTFVAGREVYSAQK